MAYGLFTEAIIERESGIVQRIKKGIEEWVTAERLNPSVLPFLLFLLLLLLLLPPFLLLFPSSLL